VPYVPRYIDPEKLSDAIPQKWIDQTTDDVDGNVTGDSALLDAIRRAESEVDDHLRPHYALPLKVDGVVVRPVATDELPSTVPDSIRDIVTDLVNYNIHGRRKIPDDVTKKRDYAMKRLEGIRDRRTTIVADPITVDSRPGVVVVSVRDPLLNKVRDRYF
jgi:hypothetical protein